MENTPAEMNQWNYWNKKKGNNQKDEEERREKYKTSKKEEQTSSAKKTKKMWYTTAPTTITAGIDCYRSHELILPNSSTIKQSTTRSIIIIVVTS